MFGCFERKSVWAVFAAVFMAGIFSVGGGMVKAADAAGLNFIPEMQQPTKGVMSWYFNGNAKIGTRTTPFVARVTFDLETPDQAGSSMGSRVGLYAIKEFVFTTKHDYIVSRNGLIKIYDNSSNSKDAIVLEVKDSIGGESTRPLKYLSYKMACHNQKNDHCGKYITSDKLPGFPPGGRWVMTSTFRNNVQLSRLGQFTEKPMALLRKPVKAPPPMTQNTPPAQNGTLTVCMKTYSNKHYVVAENNKKTVNANRPHCQEWERHTLIDLNGGVLNNGDSVALKTHWGLYWSAQPNGRLEANRTKLDSWERFTIRKVGGPGGNVISYGSKIGLRGAHGKYVVAEGAGGKNVNANRAQMKTWETFTLTKP